LLKLPGFDERLEPFDSKMLGYPWRHADPRVDRLQQSLQDFVAREETQSLPRAEIFGEIWRMAHAALGRSAAPLAVKHAGRAVPRLSEPWYCCAEPTSQQLAAM
jgi:hypothetical protein